MSDTMIAVRLSLEQKQHLEQLAARKNQTVSDVIRNWIDGDSVMDGISPDLLERIRAEAARRNIPTHQLTRTLLMWAWEHLRKDTGRLLIFD